MINSTVTDEQIRTVESERSRTIALYEEAQQALASAKTREVEAESAYATARVAPDFDSKVAERLLAAREKAAHAKQVWADRVADLHIQGVEIEDRRNELIELRRREVIQSELAQVYSDFESANSDLIADLRALYAEYPSAPLDLYWGGEHTLRYLVRIGTLQARLAALVPPNENGTSTSLPSLGSGIVRMLWDRGMLDPGYNGPLDPMAVA